jgi:DNA invertase Pin-like site-specific DNA recombinase
MLAVLAEFERDQIAERTSAALQHMIAQKKRVGEIRYGYALAVDGKNLVPVESEQAVITKIKLLRDRKLLSFSTISRLLTVLRVPTKQGTPGSKWWPRVVKAIYRANCA